MGLDLYAGTLTRYYTHNWKSAVEQWAEENGYRFSRLTPGGEEIEEELPDPGQVREGVCAWRDAALAAISPEGQPYAPWPEDNHKAYWTDKPDWDAYGALLLYALCRLYGEPLPRTVEKGWDFNAHPVIQRGMQDAKHRWSLFSGAEMWLPLGDAILFECRSPAGDDVVVSTTGALRTELERINSTGWQAGLEEIAGWSETQGYPTEGQVVDGEVVHLGEEDRFDTESLAKFAFSLFYQGALFAEENGVPLLLDY